MTQDQIWSMIWQDIGIELHGFAVAFAAHPTPFIVAGALFILGALIPTTRRRRRS